MDWLDRKEAIIKMSINHQEAHKRFRVYVSLGHKNSIQEYFGYGEQFGAYRSKSAALKAAKARHEELVKEHCPPALADNPFKLDKRFSCGVRGADWIPLKCVTVRLETNIKYLPEWKAFKNHIRFGTYAPRLYVEKFQYINDRRVTMFREGYCIEDSRLFKSAWALMCLDYCRHMPIYKPHIDKMLDAAPSHKTFCKEVKEHARRIYGDDFI